MSSARVALPTFDPKELEKLLKALMKVDGPSEFVHSERAEIVRWGSKFS